MSDYIEQGVLGLAFFLSASNLWLTRHALSVIERNSEILSSMRGVVQEHTRTIRAIIGDKKSD